MAKDKTATLWAEGGDICLRFDFSREVLEELKSKWDWKRRKWNPEKKIWIIDPAIAEEVETWFKSIGYQVSVMNQQIEIAVDSSDYAQKFINIVPIGILKKAYQLASIALHPDKGGSQESMAQLNDSWAEIKRNKVA